MQSAKKRVEHRLDVTVPSLLVMVGDESSVNLSLFHWMASVGEVNTVFIRDVAHRSWNDAKLGIVSAGLWGDFLELMTIMFTLQGPWLSAAWFTEMQEAAEIHMSRANENCPWFQSCADELVLELGAECKADPHTEEGRKEVWEKLKERTCLDRRGQCVTTTRWFQWVHRYASYQKHHWSHSTFCSYSATTAVCSKLLSQHLRCAW
eukprot:6491249-Amphidinium_carterae.3